MTLKAHTFRIGSPRRRGEGLRIGTVRFLPRGVRKADYARQDYFDLWLPSVAPSRELLATIRSTGLTPATFASFARHYASEMKRTDARQTIALLAALAQHTPLAVGCYCEDEACCHRSVLIKLIRAAAEAI